MKQNVGFFIGLKHQLMRVDDVFESIDSTIISKTCKIFQKKFWLDQIFNISKYKPLSGSSYIKLPKETDHPKKFD